VSTARALFETPAFQCVELMRYQAAQLQSFIEHNPEYYLMATGALPGPHEAEEEFDAEPPSDWQSGRKWMLAFIDCHGAMIGIADLISDLLAPHVWHIGLFIAATSLHGTGLSQTMYDGLEGWIRRQDARWIRLGVIAGNARAERFWERQGYCELRTRELEMGARVHTVRVMVKPLGDADLRHYLELVARDRP